MVDISLGTKWAGYPATPHTLPTPYALVEGMLLKGGRITDTDDLAPGHSHQYSAELELPMKIRPGKYWIGITCDPYNRLKEDQPYPHGEHDNVTNIDIEIVTTP